jgi:two-component system, cell cycle sensor histidine kinase and response regulator CckA
VSQTTKTQTRFMLRLMLGIIVLCVGFGFSFLFLQDILFNRTLVNFEKQIENDKNRIHIGKYIIEDLAKVERNFHKTLSIFNPKEQDYIIAQIKTITNELALELDVIEKGGVLIKTIPLNIPEKNFLEDKVSYQPVGQDKYIEEILVLRVLLSDIKDQIPMLLDLLNQRQLVHSGTIPLQDLSYKMSSFFRKLDPQFKRMEEYANKIFYDSTIHTGQVERAIAERKKNFSRMAVLSSVFVLLIITIIGLIISKRIIERTLHTIRKEENKFRGIADFSYDWDEWILTDGSYGYVSPACARISGYNREEFLHNPNLFDDILHPDDRKKINEHRRNHLNQESPKAELNFRIIRKDGQVRWIWHQCQPLFNHDGVWSGRRTTNRDVTSLHNAQKDLELNEQRLTLALQGGELGLWDWNIETGEFVCNERWFEMLEYQPEDLNINLEIWKKTIHPDDFTGVMEKLGKHLQGENEYFDVEYRSQTKSEQWIWILSKGKVIERDSAGNPLRAVGTYLDISEHKKKEDQKRALIRQQEQIQRLKSLDLMAGAIAHRFNNSMMAVTGNLELIIDSLPGGSPEKEMATDAQEAANDASRVGTMMLTYVGQGKQQHSQINFVEMVQEAVSEIKNKFIPAVTVSFTPPPTSFFCKMDKKQIKEVIISIITNAIESIDSCEGDIEITCGEDHFTSNSFPIIFQGDKLKDGVYAYCQIRDSGCGILHDDLMRIFEPFFTTKFIGRGLGLAMATGVMRSHHGALMVESSLGEGSTVRVLLPSVPHTEEISTREIQQAGEAAKLTGKILLADDENPLLNVGTRMLEKIGFTVITAVDGVNAVEQADKHADELCAVIMDVSMPNMDGIEAMMAIKRKHPDIPILLSSGYSKEDVLGNNKAGSKADSFLSKPFQRNELETKLKEILARSSREKQEDSQ